MLVLNKKYLQVNEPRCDIIIYARVDRSSNFTILYFSINKHEYRDSKTPIDNGV